MTRISPALLMLALLCALEGAHAGLWCDATTTALDKVRLIKLRARRDRVGGCCCFLPHSSNPSHRSPCPDPPQSNQGLSSIPADAFTGCTSLQLLDLVRGVPPLAH